MRVHQEELTRSSHARDAEGREITCSQCHIPSGNVVRMLAAKSWLGVRDIWAHANGKGEDPGSRGHAGCRPTFYG